MDIECTFENLKVFQQPGTFYTCKATKISLTTSKRDHDREIRNLMGEHEDGKTNRDVEAICFLDQELHYMPRNLANIFPNLKVIEIKKCGLKEVTRQDLIGLEDIEVLYLDENELQLLPDDLLEGMKKVKDIDFGENKLKFFSSQLLQPVLENQLTYVDFRKNPTINVTFNIYEDPHKDEDETDEEDEENEELDDTYYCDNLPELMQIIDSNCEKPPRQAVKTERLADLASKLSDFWTSGSFSDFTIFVGDRKFPVHKIILAGQSGYFAEIFQNSEESLLTIEDLSVDAVQEVLQWMYRRDMPSSKNAIEVFALSEKLNLTELKPIAEAGVLNKLQKESATEGAIEIFMVGNRYKSEKLKEKAFKKIKIFLNEPNLDENFMEAPEKLKKLVGTKKAYEELKTCFKNLK